MPLGPAPSPIPSQTLLSAVGEHVTEAQPESCAGLTDGAW